MMGQGRQSSCSCQVEVPTWKLYQGTGNISKSMCMSHAVARQALHKILRFLAQQALPFHSRAVTMLGGGIGPERLQLTQAHCSLKAAEGCSLLLTMPRHHATHLLPVTSRAAGVCTHSNAESDQQQAHAWMSCTHKPAADSQSLGMLPAKEL